MGARQGNGLAEHDDGGGGTSGGWQPSENEHEKKWLSAQTKKLGSARSGWAPSGTKIFLGSAAHTLARGDARRSEEPQTNKKWRADMFTYIRNLLQPQRRAGCVSKMSSSPSFVLLAAACTCLLATPAVAECSGPQAFGEAYLVEQQAEGQLPMIDDDELVVHVWVHVSDPEGLASGGAACAVSIVDQFELTWFKRKEPAMAMLTLKRTAPKECVGLRGSLTYQGVELRMPLPEDLKTGAGSGDFSRVLLGLPPGGIYESFLLRDYSAITGSAAMGVDEEHEVAQADEVTAGRWR